MGSNSNRIDKIAEEIKKELSLIIQTELKDPRIPKLTSVVAVNVTKDLKFAKAFISVFGTPEDKVNAIEGLKSAAGFLRREIGNRIQIRYMPEIHFEIDNSIEHGAYITKLIDDTLRNK